MATNLGVQGGVMVYPGSAMATACEKLGFAVS